MDLDNSIIAFKKSICTSLDKFQKEVEVKTRLVKLTLDEINQKELRIEQIEQTISNKTKTI